MPIRESRLPKQNRSNKYWKLQLIQASDYRTIYSERCYREDARNILNDMPRHKKTSLMRGFNVDVERSGELSNFLVEDLKVIEMVL